MKKLAPIATLALLTACATPTQLMYRPMLVTAVKKDGSPVLCNTGTPVAAAFNVGDTVKFLFHQKKPLK